MGYQGTARETLQAFCRNWFELRDADAVIALLADEVEFVGSGSKELAVGKEQMAAYIKEDIGEIAEPFVCGVQFLHEQMLAERVCSLSTELTLKNAVYTWRLRCFFILVQEDGETWLVRSLHAAEPGSSQRGREHYPKALVMEHIVRQRQELLNDSLLGGMMGGYIEKDFPFYFINRQMLQYLGYSDEAEFVADIGGLISHCMHPDDREAVDQEVVRQLALRDEYVVEYRMKKKDGSYIWIHDSGRRTVAEDGRPAISSVCIDITAQKEAQQEILRLYNNIPGAVFRCLFDGDLTVIEANDGLFEFLGYTREEFAGMGNRMRGVIPPEDWEAAAQTLKEQLRQGDTVHLEERILCKGGSIKWASIKAQLFHEVETQYFYCVFVDITDEKRLQERVRELYEKELAYFSELSAKEGCLQGTINITQDRVENYLSTSDVAVTHVGDTYERVIRNLAESAVDLAYGEEIRRTLEKEKVLADYAAGRVDYRLHFLRKRNQSGSFWGDTNLRTCLNPATGDIIMFFYTVDVTEQKLQGELLSRIAELDYDVITDIDLEKGSYRLSAFDQRQPPAISLEGDFQAEIRRVASLCMDEDAQTEFLSKLDFSYMERQLEEQDSYAFVLELRDSRGPRIKRFQVFYISKALRRVCMTRTDVTDVVRQEQKQKDELAAALVAAEQANAAKSDFLSRMSHEIRTPMNAIIGMSTIAVQSLGDDEQVADCISKIGISSRFLLSLINDILDMSRIESGKMLLKSEKIPMEEFINGLNSICHAQAAAKGVDYECIVDPVLDDYYMGDAMKLQQVLLNILSNAIKFTGESGKVTFSAAQRRRAKNDAVLRFIVNDTGVGINEEFLPHIFEPFSQESTGTTALYGGTGLGLAISKSIVDMMDGKITVRSIKGIGTEFTVDVKLGITEEAKTRHHQKQQGSYNFSHLKTLVVDDDVAVCESAMVTLHEIGIEAEWVDSGRKAIDRVKALCKENRYFDMILIDWKMPEMDGLETARRIRELVGPEVTIIIITAYDWVGIEHEAKLAGVNLLMSKPMFKSSLVSAFSKALGQKEEQAQQQEIIDYDFTGKRVLLAEDNALNTEVAVMLLQSKGFAVDTAETGLRALEMFSKSTPGYYDAILMDIRMPQMDGLTAANNIRHLSNADAGAIPIIAMTANAFDDDIEKSKAAGMNAHLAKPIDPNRLYQTLYDFIFRKEE